MADIEQVIQVWGDYVGTIQDWQALTEDIAPKQSGCGPIYEMPNPIPGRPEEDFCIADMRNLAVTDPHYHPEGVTEIYFVIQGLGKIMVGHKEEDVAAGSVVVMPPRTAHYTVPAGDLVIAVVNTPPFTPESYISIGETDESVQFDKNQFEQLTNQ